jgi:hypothetical protein
MKCRGWFKFFRLLQLAVFMAVATFTWAASPCAGVDRNLTNERKKILSPEIARQLKVKRADVRYSFRADGWTILYVNTYDSDDVYLFYSHNPLTSRHITEWGGAAEVDEEREIRTWIIKHAPGIPGRLAGCFAWHVTKEDN